ncbi:MAG: hypothetical protein SAL70_22955 [Scytonema sp. PMC 1070.18]|nr:hypothetical protein [Scytonema sp. PMC 1070.18]
MVRTVFYLGNLWVGLTLTGGTPVPQEKRIDSLKQGQQKIPRQNAGDVD